MTFNVDVYHRYGEQVFPLGMYPCSSLPKVGELIEIVVSGVAGLMRIEEVRHRVGRPVIIPCLYCRTEPE